MGNGRRINESQHFFCRSLGSCIPHSMRNIKRAFSNTISLMGSTNEFRESKSIWDEGRLAEMFVLETVFRIKGRDSWLGKYGPYGNKLKTSW